MTKDMLPELLMSCLQELGGEASIVKVCKCFWEHYEEELKHSGDLLYPFNVKIVETPVTFCYGKYRIKFGGRTFYR